MKFKNNMKIICYFLYYEFKNVYFKLNTLYLCFESFKQSFVNHISLQNFYAIL